MNTNTNKRFSYQQYLPEYQYFTTFDYDAAYEAEALCVSRRLHAFLVYCHVYQCGGGTRDAYENWARHANHTAGEVPVKWCDNECDKPDKMLDKPLSWLQCTVQWVKNLFSPAKAVLY